MHLIIVLHLPVFVIVKDSDQVVCVILRMASARCRPAAVWAQSYRGQGIPFICKAVFLAKVK